MYLTNVSLCISEGENWSKRIPWKRMEGGKMEFWRVQVRDIRCYVRRSLMETADAIKRNRLVGGVHGLR